MATRTCEPAALTNRRCHGRFSVTNPIGIAKPKSDVRFGLYATDQDFYANHSSVVVEGLEPFGVF